MREIRVSTDVFARVWSLRRDGEDSEDAILRRVLWNDVQSPSRATSAKILQTEGLHDRRFGVVFPEGFEIERNYLGNRFVATVQNGQWVIEGVEGRFSKLNELSRAIETGTENAWANWYFIDENNRRRAVSDLRNPKSIASRPRAKKARTDFTQESVRWCDDVRSALVDLGGIAHLEQIYETVKNIRRAAGRSIPRSLEAVVRRELEMRSSDSEVYDTERGEDWFKMAEGKGNGVWALRKANEYGISSYGLDAFGHRWQVKGHGGCSHEPSRHL